MDPGESGQGCEQAFVGTFTLQACHGSVAFNDSPQRTGRLVQSPPHASFGAKFQARA